MARVARAKKRKAVPVRVLCKARAKESRKLSVHVRSRAASVMLRHIAETWKRVGREAAGTLPMKDL